MNNKIRKFTHVNGFPDKRLSHIEIHPDKKAYLVNFDGSYVENLCFDLEWSLSCVEQNQWKEIFDKDIKKMKPNIKEIKNDLNTLLLKNKELETKCKLLENKLLDILGIVRS